MVWSSIELRDTKIIIYTFVMYNKTEIEKKNISKFFKIYEKLLLTKLRSS